MKKEISVKINLNLPNKDTNHAILLNIRRSRRKGSNEGSFFSNFHIHFSPLSNFIKVELYIFRKFEKFFSLIFLEYNGYTFY